MTRSDDPAAAKRQRLTEALADILLADGVAALSLRPAAARLGTSDRMLLYYFDNKARLITEVLATTSGRLAQRLEALPAHPRMSPGELVRRAAGLFLAEETRPFMRVWAELTGLAAAGEQPYADAARAAAEGWLDWIVQRVDFPPRTDVRQGASALLTILEGAALLDLSCPGLAASAIPRLAELADGGRAPDLPDSQE